MANTDEILKVIAQSAVIEQIVEKRLEQKLKNPDYALKEAIKRGVLDALNDYSVQNKIKEIAKGR